MTYVHVTHVESFFENFVAGRFYELQVVRQDLQKRIRVVPRNISSLAVMQGTFFVTSEKSRNIFKVRLEVYLRILF